MKINRLLINICSDNLPASKHFYTSLFDFKVDYDSDWFVHLIGQDSQLELGIIDRNSEVVPSEAKNMAGGSYLTFVVASADELLKIAQEQGFSVVEEPKDTFYGQRRLLLKDPDGYIVDVSSLIGG